MMRGPRLGGREGARALGINRILIFKIGIGVSDYADRMIDDRRSGDGREVRGRQGGHAEIGEV